jgi:muramoyltetrapeptide carboxypeptidase
MIRPRRLHPGDAVALVAPSGPVSREAFAGGAAILGERYRLVYGARLFERRGFLAGDDDARARELQAALADPSIAAVMLARGGYGLTRILDRLDSAAFARAPKPILGFSDGTALHAWAARAGVQSIHSPVVTQLGLLSVEDGDALVSLVERPEPPRPLEGLRALAPGRAEGWLFGGNLEVLSRLCGTPHLPLLDGAVLLLEEVSERPYRIDRSLTQLISAGALAGVRGVVVGALHRCDEPDMPTPEEVVRERLAPLGVPIVAGAPIGHAARNRAVPLGARVTVDAPAGRVEFHEGAVE